MILAQLKTPARTRREKVLAFLPAAAWYAVIFAFSAQTGEESGRLSGALVERSIDWMGEWGKMFQTDWDAVLLLSFLVRKAAHMGIFFILTGLLFLAFWRIGTRPPLAVAAPMALCGLLAVLDEFHQTFVPGRDGKLPDVLVDLGGGVCFLLAWWVVRTLQRGRRRDRLRENGSIQDRPL